jgi:hypothetical protein
MGVTKRTLCARTLRNRRDRRGHRRGWNDQAVATAGGWTTGSLLQGTLARSLLRRVTPLSGTRPMRGCRLIATFSICHPYDTSTDRILLLGEGHLLQWLAGHFGCGHRSNGGDQSQHNQIDRNRPSRAAGPAHKCRRRKRGQAAADRCADLEAERSAAVPQSRREEFRIPWRADTEPDNLPKDDGGDDR